MRLLRNGLFLMKILIILSSIGGFVEVAEGGD